MSAAARRVRRATRYLAATDGTLIGRSAGIRPSELDRTMLRLSRSANHSLLWCAVSAALVAKGDGSRRGAVRGLLAVAGASALANGVLKPVFPRRRPPVETMPVVRRLLHPPTSSSFPSGHSASAAAFATGVALESPVAGAVIAPLAAAVAYSRVHVGVHWPSDVLVGAGVGAAVGLGTRRWWAVRAEDPAALGRRVELPALPDGRGLSVFVNPSSGAADDDPAVELRELLPAARTVEIDTDRDLMEQLDAAVDAEAPSALGISGGDATVQAVAQVAIRHGLPLAVLPGGTLNHFARDAGVVEVAGTAKAVSGGQAELIDTAEVTIDGQSSTALLNTASIGGYPDSVQLREKLQHRMGKWPAAALAMFRVLQRAAPLELELDGKRVAVWMVFVGNGRYVPADQVPMSRATLCQGTIDVRYLRADTRASRTRLLFAAATGTLGGSPTYVQRSVTEMTLQVLGDPVTLATDGEVIGQGRRFAFRSRPESLAVYSQP